MVIRIRINIAHKFAELEILSFDFHQWGMPKKRVFCMFFNFGDFSRIQNGRDPVNYFFKGRKHLGTGP
jgi:hypothetical protein